MLVRHEKLNGEYQIVKIVTTSEGKILCLARATTSQTQYWVQLKDLIAVEEDCTYVPVKEKVLNQAIEMLKYHL